MWLSIQAIMISTASLDRLGRFFFPLECSDKTGDPPECRLADLEAEGPVPYTSWPWPPWACAPGGYHPSL